MLFSKSLSVFLVVYLFSDCTGGPINHPSFRLDYNYIEAVNSFYKFHQTEKNWRDAKLTCALEGASLFYPENSEEANAVISYWKRYQSNAEPINTWVHVGLTDLINEGIFETIDGKSISEVYKNWRPDQPDDWNEEDCVQLNQEGQINDCDCSDAKYSFICKKSFKAPEQNSCNTELSNLGEQRNHSSFQLDYNYIEAVESFYKFHQTEKNWREAKLACTQEGASLFYPENSEEANAVISYWKQYQSNSEPVNTYVHVGLTDLINEGIFETIDGKSISEVYKNWRTDQPDNWNEEDCVQLNQEGQINDCDCSDAKNSFICKKSFKRNHSCNTELSNMGGQRNQSFFRMDYNYIAAVKSFYKVHTTSTDWNSAEQACSLEGARLFYPENREEANAVMSLWKLYQNTAEPVNTWVHVGISDKTTEGIFETIDGKSISDVYHSWRPDQPDNWNDEDCVHLNQEGQINDCDCRNAKYSFICKKRYEDLELNCSFVVKPTNTNGPGNNNRFREDYSYIETTKGFYKIHKTLQTWADAKRMCALEGASLFYPDNRDEANAVISFWRCSQSNIQWSFVGMSDIISEGVFETVDGKPASEVYTQWQGGQPNNMGGNEDCVHLNIQGDLNDVPCDEKSHFICKKSLESLKWNDKCNMSNLDYTLNQDVGKCYKLHTTPLNWADAYAVCHAEQSHLAMIDSQSEADYLADLTQSATAHSVQGGYFRGVYHMGFHNKLYEGWQTVKGLPLNMDASVWWDNQKPHENDRDQCGSMFYTGQLSTINCQTKSFFICEHKVDNL